jgi:hypothetical protein
MNCKYLEEIVNVKVNVKVPVHAMKADMSSGRAPGTNSVESWLGRRAVLDILKTCLYGNSNPGSCGS